MRIIMQAVRVIDYEGGRVLARAVIPELGEYIEQLVSYIYANTSVREYHTQSAGTEVVKRILAIKRDPENSQLAMQEADKIAERLLQKETAVQERIAPMNVRVQKGSLILALVEEEGETVFLLAKVEHTDFFDEMDYSLKSGFSKDEKKIWKTCLLEMDDAYTSMFSAKIYSNTDAKYWWHDFLELVECESDENNTKKAFQSVESALNKSLKKTAPYDCMVIRNAMYAYFNSAGQFDFMEMLDRTITKYKPNDMTEEEKDNLLQKLQNLPKEKGFDCRFISKPAVIKPKMRKTYDVYNNIQLKILGEIDDLGDVVQSFEEKDGTRYLKIQVNNDDVFRTFKRRA